MATTINATRSYEEYEKEQIDKATSRVNAQAAAYKQNQDQTLSQIGAAIDRSANTAAGVYQQRIDGADAAYKSQYADNAIDEAFAREQVKNSMAASGMTDSGQNLTMQTALSLQRNNRDAAVTENKRNYVQEMQNAIDAVWADAAAQKSAQEVTAQQNYQTFYDNLYANAMSGAQENAVNLYNADLAAQQAAYEAEQQSAAEQAKAKAEAEAAAMEKITNTAVKLIQSGDYAAEDAYALATAMHTGQDIASLGAVSGNDADADRAALQRAVDVIGDQNVLGGAQGGWDWWQNRLFRTDAGEVNATISEVTKELETRGAYKQATDAEKEYMVALAVANSLSSSRGTAKEKEILLPYLQKALTEKQYAIVEQYYDVKDATTQQSASKKTSGSALNYEKPGVKKKSPMFVD